jgi:hypothetical protein
MLRRPLIIIALAAGAAMLPMATVPFGGAAAVAAQKGVGVTKKVGKALQEAQDLQKSGDLKGALAKAQEADALPKKSPYDQFAIDEVMGNIYANLKDYKNALARYESAAKSEFVSPQSKPGLDKAIITLAYAAGDGAKALDYAAKYTQQYGEDLDVMAIESNVYLDQKKYDKAYSTANEIMTKAASNNVKPKEAWLKLLLYSASGAKKDSEVRRALLGLVQNYPTQAYWHDFLGELFNQPKLSDLFKLNVFRLMLDANAILAPDEYLSGAKAAINAGYPAEAKKFLDAGKAAGMIGPGKNQEQDKGLASNAAGQAAADKNKVDSYAAKAKASAGGSDDVDIGELYYSYGHTDKAIAMIKAGIAAGKLKNPSEPYLALGRIYFETGKIDQAKAEFAKVTTGGNDGELAKAWIALCNEKSAPAATAGAAQ